MLPKKCLTACEVPYLCAIACPLNNQLEDIELAGASLIDANEPLDVEIAETEKTSTTPTDDEQPTA